MIIDLLRREGWDDLADTVVRRDLRRKQAPALRTEKRCPKCRKVKSIEAFHRDRSRPDGHEQYCRTCVQRKGEYIEGRRAREHRQREVFAQGLSLIHISEPTRQAEIS